MSCSIVRNIQSFIDDSHDTPLCAFAKCDFPSIIHDNFFKCNYFMCEFAPKMQVLYEFDFNMLPYGVDWDAMREVNRLCTMEEPCRAF